MRVGRRIAIVAAGAVLVASVAVATMGTALAEPDPTTTTTSGPTTTTTTTAGHAQGSAPGAAAGPVTVQADPIAYTTIEGDGCQLATIDLTTALVTPLPAGFSSLACVNDLGFGADGVLYGVKQEETEPLEVHLLRFDTTTGAPTDLGAITGNFTSSTMFGFVEGGVAAGPDNRLYVDMGTNDPVCTAGSFQCLYRVDPATLAATLVGAPGAPGGAFDDRSLFPLTSDCVSSFWVGWFPQGGGSPLSLATLALSNGAGTPGPALGVPRFLDGLEIDKASNMMYALAEGDGQAEALYIVDRTTGTATLVAPTPPVIGRVFRLAIPGTCPTATHVPAGALAIVVEPRFTG